MDVLVTIDIRCNCDLFHRMVDHNCNNALDKYIYHHHFERYRDVL